MDRRRRLTELRTGGLDPQTMNKQLKEKYLVELDTALLPLGFKRPQTKYQWTRIIGSADLEWIHLNFGLAVINPSLGVEYKDIGNLLPAEAGAVSSVSKMLTSLTGTDYSEDTDPEVLVEDILKAGIDELANLRSRSDVISKLETDSVDQWPVRSASDRMRLLPLLLASEGNLEKGYEWLAKFEKMALRVDQLVPKYSEFAKYFKRTYMI